MLSLSLLCATTYRDPPHLSVSSHLLPHSFYPSFPFLSVNPRFSGRGPAEAQALDGAPALRLDSSTQAWELLDEFRRSMVVVVCVCVCVCILRGSHVEAEGKYSFGHCC